MHDDDAFGGWLPPILYIPLVLAAGLVTLPVLVVVLLVTPSRFRPKWAQDAVDHFFR